MKNVTMEAIQAAQIAKLKLATAAKEPLERSPTAPMSVEMRSKLERKTVMLARIQAVLTAKSLLATVALALMAQLPFVN